ncbi:hypothetical protein NF27_HE00120 [Candidatus Jidaibacter acanthamoeba]|uniref:Uncharacterized protein n=1 Tax=Candidatus Jidaibacter acanthamoebae TaxID=86105 RepID=A0A0C1QKG1_9RICK|nr:hypothetical protein [Candidatus Jidaibacter acanthamoeba]KIE04623.1 hypothetical protein NF27_HE00120 [Candidatus Jidaibacter acanthamoeba]
MPSSEIESHLEGLSGFISENHSKEIDLYYPLSRVYNVRLVIGCVINPGFDKEGEVLEFIKSFSNELKCMTFYNNALWDYDWQCLAAIR